jgi:hypothetical protein
VHEFHVGIGERPGAHLSHDVCGLELLGRHVLGGNVVDAGHVHERGFDIGELVRGCAALPQ